MNVYECVFDFSQVHVLSRLLWYLPIWSTIHPSATFISSLLDSAPFHSITNLNRKFPYQLIHLVHLRLGKREMNKETWNANVQQRTNWFVFWLNEKWTSENKKTKKKKDAVANKKWLCGSDIDLWRFPNTLPFVRYRSFAYFKC